MVEISCTYRAILGKHTMNKKEVNTVVCETSSVDEYCQITGVGRNTTYEDIRLGKIPVIRSGKRLRIPNRWIERQLNGDGLGHPPPDAESNDGPQVAKVIYPSGGDTQDAEARTAINAIIDVLKGVGSDVRDTRDPGATANAVRSQIPNPK